MSGPRKEYQFITSEWVINPLEDDATYWLMVTGNVNRAKTCLGVSKNYLVVQNVGIC